MPRFYFDVIDQGIVEVDEEGIDLPDLATAVDQARMMMEEMTLEATPGKTTASLVIQIRDGPTMPMVTVTATVGTKPEISFHGSPPQ